MPAAAEGRILKNPNRDFDAIKSVSFKYSCLRSSIFDIFLLYIISVIYSISMEIHIFKIYLIFLQ